MIRILDVLVRYSPIFGFASLIAATVVYAHTTFSTIDYVDKKHVDVRETLQEIRETQREMHTMIIELYKERRR